MNDFIEPSDDLSAGGLVVDLPHRDLVLRRLHETARPLVRVGQVAQHNGLDLCRIGLESVSADGDISDLGSDAILAVLDDLRRGFAAQFDGWAPEMEADPEVTGIVGFLHTKPMSLTTELRTARGAGFTAMAAPDAGAGVRVAVLDVGLVKHPDLTNVSAAADGLVSAAPPLEPWMGHGTFVAGLIAQRAPACDIVVHKVLNLRGKATTWHTAVALADLAMPTDSERPYDIVNLSLGCRIGGPSGPLALRRAVQLHAGRRLLVAAAGNHGFTPRPATPVWPAAFPGVAAVGATHVDSTGTAVLSDITPRLPWVDYLALGSGVTSTFLPDTLTDGVDYDGFATWSGTSFAAANLSGAVAAELSKGGTPFAALDRVLRNPGYGVTRFDWRATDHAK
ncbi:S8 family peptidase [Asanoa siamensis]|uniref:Peptidase S8/S53 domain-containing protein n=1 Tax=Asanoa siamensis TaxID=926357 RepID=A0ABQ4D5N7_9ACTN|nr:S8 family serine peptidase [Asanoa siamensis]GIF78427.1 hypothetical protein Asi02nite_79450 [Asanoa siamensis]